MKKKYLLTLLLCCIGHISISQIPLLNSQPGSSRTVYLKFDGGTVNNPNWLSSPIIAAPAPLNTSQIIEVFNRVAEKYIIFNINITTDSSVYNATPVNSRMRCFITPTSQWYGSAGGVAFVGAFGYSNYEPCWIFSNMLSNNPKYISDAAAHEIGHTLWLNHHGQYNITCDRISTYHPGKGTGQIGWGPIMGAPYSVNIGQWYNGPTTTLKCSDNNQNDFQKMIDFGTLGSTQGIPLKPDDIGNSTSQFKILSVVNTIVSDSGIISSDNDKDWFRFNLSQTGNVTLNIRPYSINQVTNDGATLKVGTRILNSSGTQLYVDTPTNTLNVSRTINNLSQGTYYLEVFGAGSSNFTDYGSQGTNSYGSVGRYYITGTIANNSTCTPPIASFNTSKDSTCLGTTIQAINTSTNYTSVTWVYGNQSSSSNNFIFNNNIAGQMNLNLTVTNNCGSASTTKTIITTQKPIIGVSPFPSTNINPGSSIVCNASGYNMYQWTPSTGLNTTSGSTVIASPSVTTTYKVIGITSLGCKDSISTVININTISDCTPPNNLEIIPSCLGTRAHWSNTSLFTTSYRLEYKAVNANVWIVRRLVVDSNIIAQRDGYYMYRVKAICSNKESVYSEIVYSQLTNLTPNLPNNINVSNISSNSVTISWMPNGARTYSVRYRIKGNWITLNTQYKSIDNYINIGGLQSNKTYQYQIRANCVIKSSNWSTVQYFNTLR